MKRKKKESSSKREVNSKEIIRLMEPEKKVLFEVFCFSRKNDFCAITLFREKKIYPQFFARQKIAGATKVLVKNNKRVFLSFW